MKLLLKLFSLSKCIPDANPNCHQVKKRYLTQSMVKLHCFFFTMLSIKCQGISFKQLKYRRKWIILACNVWAHQLWTKLSLLFQAWARWYWSDITFQHAEPPKDQICQISFQYHQLHRFYGKSPHQLLSSFEMTHFDAFLYLTLITCPKNNHVKQVLGSFLTPT